ncbi:ADP-ribosyltransferase-containing protein [Xanthomonas euvesicatoria]
MNSSKPMVNSVPSDVRELWHSPAFQGWFGASKVVDADGNPARVYHGSTVWQHDGRSLGDFEVFDRLASVNIVGRRHSVDTLGSWFSTEPGLKGAEMYSSSRGVIYPVYLSIQDPWVPQSFNSLIRIGHRLAGTNPETVSKGPGIYESGALRFGQDQVDALRAWLKAVGHDGILIKQEAAEANSEWAGQAAWIALEPNQIKSALANAGSFDPADPRIAFKRELPDHDQEEDDDESFRPTF